MRVIRFVNEQDQVCLGLDRGNNTAELVTGDLFGELEPTGRTAAVRKLLAPVVPSNIFCIGVNYRAHAREAKSEVPDYPIVFMKGTGALLDPGAPICIPACCADVPQVDFECELAVVIGRPAKSVSEAEALDYVLGYTCANDVSARKWQKECRQWVHGKGFDTFCPLGPALVTPEDVPDPQRLAIRTLLNGQVMQDSSTADMIWSVAQLISFVSQDTTLPAGTVILTGTPEGVGFARTPPVFLKPGDEVVVEIENIGRLVNTVAGLE